MREKTTLDVFRKRYLCLGGFLTILFVALLPGMATAQTTLFGSPFVTSFGGWTDTCVVNAVDPGPPTWGVLLGDDDALCEANNVITGPATSTWPLGEYDTQNMINMNYTTTAAYTLTARMGTWDDDGYGLVWAYEDEDNYFRLGFRQQDTDSFGFPRGLSVQKVSGGTVYQLGQNTAIRASLPYDDGSYFDVSVTVDELGGYSIKANPGGGAMTELLTGTDDDLALMAAGHYGIHSWAQCHDANPELTVVRPRGTLVKWITVDEGSNTTIDQSDTFADAITTAWRPMMMTNANGLQGDVGSYGLGDGTPAGFNYGNFRLDFRNGTIFDDSNSFVWSTPSAPSVDFLGSAIVVDEAGSDAWTDYEMKVRITPGDNEGPGVLVRVQDDNTFYRINFATQTISDSRCPKGMSIQKCVDNGEDPPIWTELFREDQASAMYTYTDNVPFDLTVKVVGNAITVTLIDDPDGAATVYSFDTVYDTTDPILSGSVAFTNWGAGDEFNGVYYSGYGGSATADLVVSVASISVPGDADGDNDVDAADAEILAGNWGDSVSNGAYGGDFNGDGVVNAKDASILAANWGTGVQESNGANAVPEPGTLLLILGGLLGLLHVRRRK